MTDLKIVNALLSDLESKQTISQECIKGIEETLGETYITSSIPLEKFTVLESRVNYNNAFECLVNKVMDKYEVDITTMHRQACAVNDALCRLKSILMNNDIHSSPLITFLQDPTASIVLDENDEPKKMMDISLSYLFGDRFFLFARRYSEYLEKLAKEDKIPERFKSKVDYFVNELKSITNQVEETPIDSPSYSIGWFKLLLTSQVDKFPEGLKDDMTVGEFLEVISPFNISRSLSVLDISLNSIKTIIDTTAGHKLYDIYQYAHYLNDKIVLNAYQSLQKSPICTNILICLLLGYNWDVGGLDRNITGVLPQNTAIING